MIYDEESDRHVHIPFEQALNATCYGAANGPKGDLFDLASLPEELKSKLETTNKLLMGKLTTAKKTQRDALQTTLAAAAAGAAKATARGALTDFDTENGLDIMGLSFEEWKQLGVDAEDALDDVSKVDAILTAVKNAVKNGHWVPVEIVIARPFIEHLMLSAVVAVAGRDTGATLFGPAGTFVQYTLSLSCCYPCCRRSADMLVSLLPRLQTCSSPPTPL